MRARWIDWSALACVVTAAIAGIGMGACDSGSDTDDPGEGGAGGTGGTVNTGGAGGTGGTANTGGAGGTGGMGGMGGAGGGTAMGAWIRLGHFSADSMGVDYCVTDANGTVRGPMIGGAGATYPSASSYSVVDPGTYVIDIIGAGQDCTAQPLGTMADYPMALDSYHTVIVDGLQADASLSVGPYEDENAPAMNNVYLNVCHENPGAPPVQIGTLGPTGMFTSLFDDGGMAITLAYQDCIAQEIPGPIAADTIIAVSADGTTADGTWTVPAEVPAGMGVTIFAYGTDALDIGLYMCRNNVDACDVLQVF